MFRLKMQRKQKILKVRENIVDFETKITFEEEEWIFCGRNSSQQGMVMMSEHMLIKNLGCLNYLKTYVTRKFAG